MKYIYRFLKEHKFEYGEVSRSKTFFRKTKLDEMRSELEIYYEKRGRIYSKSQRKHFLINDMRKIFQVTIFSIVGMVLISILRIDRA